MKEEDLVATRARIGVLFQEGGLFDSLSIDENVSYPLLYQRARKTRTEGPPISERVRDVLRFVELERTLNQFPGVIGSAVDDASTADSRGESRYP